MTTASSRRLQRTSSGYLLLLLLTIVSQPSLAGAQSAVALTFLGLLCVVTACLGRIWCSIFIAGRKDRELVTHGPYALCRHPLYTLSLLGGLGVGLATLSLSLSLAVLGGLWWLLSEAAHSEERQLAAQFADDYDRYRETTPAFWPKTWRLTWSTTSPAVTATSPNELLVHPRILWKAFVDAGAFFLLFACVALARQISLHYPLASGLRLW